MLCSVRFEKPDFVSSPQNRRSKMEEVVVYSFPKNQDEEIRFTLRSYKDRNYLDIRLWFQTSAAGDFHPAKKGITLGVEHLAELKKGFEQATLLAGKWALQSSLNPVK